VLEISDKLVVERVFLQEQRDTNILEQRVIMGLVANLKVMYKVREFGTRAQMLLAFDEHFITVLRRDQSRLIQALTLLQALIMAVEIVLVQVTVLVTAHF